MLPTQDLENEKRKANKHWVSPEAAGDAMKKFTGEMASPWPSTKAGDGEGRSPLEEAQSSSEEGMQQELHVVKSFGAAGAASQARREQRSGSDRRRRGSKGQRARSALEMGVGAKKKMKWNRSALI